MPISLTPKSKALLVEQGYQVALVEHYNAFTKRKHDLFGCIDLLAIGNGETVAVQVTSKSNLAARKHKVEEAEAYPEMLRSKWRVILHGWFKENNRWQLKEVEL
jgi:hypothetical protein